MLETEADRVDDVKETYRHSQMGVKVERVVRSGSEEGQELLKVYHKRTHRYRSLEGDGVRDVEEWFKIGEYAPQVATELLFGLAESHGYDLEGK